MSNGRGNDHGYGGHHLVLGGLVNGGRMGNRSPPRLRPMVEWMGVTDEAALLWIFPHLNNYNSSHLFAKG